MTTHLIAAALVVLASLFGLGLSCGQIARCVRRKQSDDVSIVAWLFGAASSLCMVLCVLVTGSSLWLAAWEGAGVAECLITVWIAWRYRQSASAAAVAVSAAPARACRWLAANAAPARTGRRGESVAPAPGMPWTPALRTALPGGRAHRLSSAGMPSARSTPPHPARIIPCPRGPNSEHPAARSRDARRCTRVYSGWPGEGQPTRCRPRGTGRRATRSS